MFQPRCVICVGPLQGDGMSIRWCTTIQSIDLIHVLLLANQKHVKLRCLLHLRWLVQLTQPYFLSLKVLLSVKGLLLAFSYVLSSKLVISTTLNS